MARASFDIHLHHLLDDLLLLGGMVEKAIATSLQALKDRDLKTSERVIKEDDIVDRKRWELEDRCLELIATQQPMAVDLRVLVTILHISVELERMGRLRRGHREDQPDDGRPAAAQAAGRHPAHGREGGRHAQPEPGRAGAARHHGGH